MCTAISPAIATTSLTGWIAPVSLFACITEITAISSPRVLTRSFRKSKLMTPSELTGISITSAPSCVASQWAGSRIAWCSILEITTIFFPTSRPAQYKPFNAMLFASVPEAVKITSLGREPISFARVSRASSRVLRVARPCVCKLEGLPNCAN
ncbi:unannotated protein [freshwater metagenome]|uniref:Unannotated protein n=1 Tax=freshwater metagenome TaxID=449393 RepID=A0A6J7WC62_9ZZZZ